MYNRFRNVAIIFDNQANNRTRQLALVLVINVYLSLECQASQAGCSRSGPPLPPPPRSTPCMRTDLTRLKASCAGRWIYEDVPSPSQTGPCEDSRCANPPHAARPLCRSPWPLTCQAACARSSAETSGTTAETRKHRLTDSSEKSISLPEVIYL